MVIKTSLRDEAGESFALRRSSSLISPCLDHVVSCTYEPNGCVSDWRGVLERSDSQAVKLPPLASGSPFAGLAQYGSVGPWQPFCRLQGITPVCSLKPLLGLRSPRWALMVVSCW